MEIVNENLLVSFSGGLTSAKMVFKLLESVREPLIVFSNTGLEHERTLEFVRDIQLNWGVYVWWVEAVIDSTQGIGTTYRIVDFDSASRNGEPFRALCAKYGLPNKSYKHCNRELKIEPIHKFACDYFNSRFKYQNYSTAIGLRVDEIDRIDKKYKKKNFLYPLIGQYPATKEDVANFWSKQSFTLELPEHYGNCVTCFKKSDRKLITIARENPSYFNHFIEYEALYSSVKAPSKPRMIFRGNKTVGDLFMMSHDTSIKSFTPLLNYGSAGLDEGESCGHDCSNN